MRILIIVLAFIILLVFVIYPFLLFKSEYLCTNFDSNSGWRCSLPSISLRIKCAIEKGEYEKVLLLPSGVPSYSCYLPYPDAGKSCIEDDECSGHCEYTGVIPTSCVISGSTEENIVYTCSEKLYGICEKTSKERNSSWKSLDDGKLHFWQIIHVPVSKDMII